MVNPLHSNSQSTSAPYFNFISQFSQCFNFWSTAEAFFQVQIQLVFSLHVCNAKYKKIIYWFWCQLFNLGVSKIAYLIIYLGTNIVSQFYWSHNLILFSFVIRDSKQWNKKVCLLLPVQTSQLNFSPESTNHPQQALSLCGVGVKIIAWYQHVLK